LSADDYEINLGLIERRVDWGEVVRFLEMARSRHGFYEPLIVTLEALKMQQPGQGLTA
jgi:hypothetical protein